MNIIFKALSPIICNSPGNPIKQAWHYNHCNINNFILCHCVLKCPLWIIIFSFNIDRVMYIFFTVQPHIIQLKNETTYENGQVTLICEAEGEPIPAITWKRAVDGITFSEGDKVTAI